MKRQINMDGASYKEWIGLMAAPVFWVASLVCFVLGLAFKQDAGVFIRGINVDLTLLFSIGLGFANTAIQIVGNDTDRDDMGISLWLMWIASYMLGIGSNVNFLYGRIGLSSPTLQFLVCWGLGVMIEVAPERLLVKFLRSIGVMGEPKYVTKPVSQSSNSGVGNRTQNQPQEMTREQRHQQMRQPQVQTGGANLEPNYHPMGGLNFTPEPKGESLPKFLEKRGREQRGTVLR